VNNLSDEQLIDRFRNGEKNEAFSALYQKYFSAVYRFIYSRLGSKDATEEVASDLFTTLYEVLGNYNGTSKLSTFIFGVSKNKVRQFIDKQSRFKFFSGYEADEFIEPEEEEKIEESESSINRKSLVVDKILSQLPKNYAQILKMKYIEGMTNKEIAEKTELEVGNIRILQHRALKKAVKLVKKDELH
jgi:RNA polymerase sigma-70 factor, ECF subfamily